MRFRFSLSANVLDFLFVYLRKGHFCVRPRMVSGVEQSNLKLQEIDIRTTLLDNTCIPQNNTRLQKSPLNFHRAMASNSSIYLFSLQRLQ